MPWPVGIGLSGFVACAKSDDTNGTPAAEVFVRRLPHLGDRQQLNTRQHSGKSVPSQNAFGFGATRQLLARRETTRPLTTKPIQRLPMHYCPNCATAVSADEIECPECGAQYDGQASWKPLLVRPKKPRKMVKTVPSAVEANNNTLINWNLLNLAMPFAYCAWLVMFFSLRFDNWYANLLCLLSSHVVSYWTAVVFIQRQSKSGTRRSLGTRVGHSILFIANSGATAVTVLPMTMYLLGGGEGILMVHWFAIPVFAVNFMLWPLGLAVVWHAHHFD